MIKNMIEAVDRVLELDKMLGDSYTIDLPVESYFNEFDFTLEKRIEDGSEWFYIMLENRFIFVAGDIFAVFSKLESFTTGYDIACGNKY